MLLSLFLALFLPCAGMSMVFLVYICLLWYAAITTGDENGEFRLPEKPKGEKGLTVDELEKMPKMRGKDLVMGNECAVCLEEIGGEQPARLIPGCNHGFHMQCADTWLLKNSVCPVCRANIDHHFFIASDTNPC